jgi:hypothetical protein
VSATDNIDATGPGPLYVSIYLSQVTIRVYCAHVWVAQPVADGHALCPGDQSVADLGVDVAVNDQSRASRADLPGIRENCPERSFDNCIDICIRKSDQRGFPAQLK